VRHVSDNRFENYSLFGLQSAIIRECYFAIRGVLPRRENSLDLISVEIRERRGKVSLSINERSTKFLSIFSDSNLKIFSKAEHEILTVSPPES